MEIRVTSISRVNWMIVSVWVWAGTLTLLSVLAFPEPRDPTPAKFSCRLNNQLGHVLIATIGILYIPAVLMVILYWQIYLVASTHLKAMKNVYNKEVVVGRSLEKGGNGGRVKSKTKTWSKINFFRFSNSTTTEPTEHSTSSNKGQGESYDGESGFSEFSHDHEESSDLSQRDRDTKPNNTHVSNNQGQEHSSSGSPVVVTVSFKQQN